MEENELDGFDIEDEVKAILKSGEPITFQQMKEAQLQLSKFFEAYNTNGYAVIADGIKSWWPEDIKTAYAIVKAFEIQTTASGVQP